MDWFVQTVLDSRCAVDPALGESFALQLASLIAPHSSARQMVRKAWHARYTRT